jgi:hypothetical protein
MASASKPTLTIKDKADRKLSNFRVLASASPSRVQLGRVARAEVISEGERGGLMGVRKQKASVLGGVKRGSRGRLLLEERWLAS